MKRKIYLLVVVCLISIFLVSCENKYSFDSYLNVEFNEENINFQGKTFSGLGDSLTALGSGNYYLDYVKDYLGLAEYTNCGVGGARICGSGENAFWQDSRINTLNDDSDYITIMGGTNDVVMSLDVNDSDFVITNFDTDNFVGAYNVMLSKIYYKYLMQDTGYYDGDIDYSGVDQVTTAKNIKILIITPPKMFYNYAWTTGTEEFAGYVKRIADLWGIPCVDANSEMEINDINKDLYWTHQTTPDYVHFSPLGHENLAMLIIDKLNRIEPLF